MDDGLTSTDVKKIVADQLGNMPEDLTRRARKYLVEPYPVKRHWSYGPELFQCWIVMIDDERSSGTGIAYCDAGVGRAECKWMLLWVEIREERYAHLGQDSSWYTSLGDAFSKSFMSTDPDESSLG